MGTWAAATWAVRFYERRGFRLLPSEGKAEALRRYWEDRSPLRLSFNVDSDRTAFATAFPARINGATGGRPLPEFDSPGLAGRPVGTTKWILRIDTSNPANRNIDFSKLKDIVLRVSYTYGNPPEFPGF